jgi:hypothetical protein
MYVTTEFRTHTKRQQNHSLYILNFKFSVLRRQDQRLWTKWQQSFPEFNLLLISSRIQFSFITVVPKDLNFATFSKDFLPVSKWWFCPAFWWRDLTIVFSVFTSRPTLLLASNRNSVLFFMVMLCCILKTIFFWFDQDSILWPVLTHTDQWVKLHFLVWLLTYIATEFLRVITCAIRNQALWLVPRTHC